MSRHITATGAFYGYVSHGLGRIVGLGAGFLTTLAYMVSRPRWSASSRSSARTCSARCPAGTCPGRCSPVTMLAVNAVLTFFDINLAARVLGVFLVTEVVMLALMAGAVLFTGGGPQGWSWGSLNPLNGFHGLDTVVPGPGGSAVAVAGSAGVGLFFAFWSWVGFRIGRDVRRGVAQPQEDHPGRRGVVGGRNRRVLRVGVVAGDRWHRPAERRCAGAGFVHRRGHLLHPVREHLGHWAVGLFRCC